MGEWISVILETGAFSEEERQLLLTLARTEKLENYCILALKTQFSRYLNPKKDENKDEPYDTIISKLSNIEDYLAKGVVPVKAIEQKEEEPVITEITPIVEIQESTNDNRPKKTNAKLSKLKKLRGG